MCLNLNAKNFQSSPKKSASAKKDESAAESDCDVIELDDEDEEIDDDEEPEQVGLFFRFTLNVYFFAETSWIFVTLG